MNPFFGDENSIITCLRTAPDSKIAANRKSSIIYDICGYVTIGLERKYELASLVYELTKHHEIDHHKDKSLTPNWLYDALYVEDKIIAISSGYQSKTELDKLNERTNRFIEELNDMQDGRLTNSRRAIRRNALAKYLYGVSYPSSHISRYWLQDKIGYEWLKLLVSYESPTIWKKQALFLLGE